MMLQFEDNTDIIDEVGFRIWCEEHLPFDNHFNSKLTTNNRMNTFLKSVLHFVVVALIFAGSLILKIHPAWLDVSVGSIITVFYTWLVSTQTTVGFSPKV